MALGKNLYDTLADMSLEERDKRPTENQDSTKPSAVNAAKGEDYEFVSYGSDGEKYYKWEVEPFDVAALETQFHNRPIFTRRFLEYIAKKKETASLRLHEGKQPLFFTHKPSSSQPGFGKEFAVMARSKQNAPQGCRISVQYLSRVELCKDFQNLHKTSHSVRLLREHNDDEDEKDWLPVPFVLDLVERDQNIDHKDPIKMQDWKEHLWRMKILWEHSKACEEIKKVIAAGKGRISRIVCFGLGTLKPDKRKCNRELEHLMAIRLAEILDQSNQKKDPVKVYFQDPMYQEKDRQLLQGLRDSIEFVEDPKGVLTIDEETLVIAAFVPTQFPLMQIIADAFEEGRGPAGFIIDHTERRHSEPGRFKINDRLSPRAERMMKHYTRWPGHFGRAALGNELEDLISNEKYWMDDMELWMRTN